MMLCFSVSILCLILFPVSITAQAPAYCDEGILPQAQSFPCAQFGGLCVKTGCATCLDPFPIPATCGSIPGLYQCCRNYLIQPARCSLVGDPHIYTFDNSFYDNHVPNWYYASRDCSGYWEVRAFFDNALSPYWTIFNTMEFRFAGGPTLVVNRNRDIAYNNLAVTTDILIAFHNGEYIIVSRHYGAQSPITVETSFGVRIEVNPFPRPELHITVTSRWLFRTCGLCGEFNMRKSDDHLQQFSSAVFGRKRREAEEEDPAIRKKREECTLQGDAESLAYCQAQLDLHSGNCPSVDNSVFLQFCAFDYCIGGNETADYSLTGFKRDCYPRKKGTCMMSGYRLIETFDGLVYNYMGSECNYELASDCSGDDIWSVSVSLKEKASGETRVVRVKITFDNQTITFHRSNNVVKVNGEIKTGTYSSPDSSFIIAHEGSLVDFISPDLQITYNFEEMVKVVAEGNAFNNTCGLCGNFNEDQSDDLTTGDSYQQDNDCNGSTDTQCPSPADIDDSVITACMGGITEIPCHEFNGLHYVAKCGQEFCNGVEGLRDFCAHLLEHMDICFSFSRDISIFDFVPEACQKCPRGNGGGGGSGGDPKPLNGCQQLGGKCLEPECDACSEGFMDDPNLCPGTNKKCCLNP